MSESTTRTDGALAAPERRSPDVASDPGRWPAPRRSPRASVLVGIGVACAVAGVLMRWWPRSALWLDEAQSVSFAKLPVTAIPAALRQDGAPPLYYIVLHAWMAVFGDASTAVRA